MKFYAIKSVDGKDLNKIVHSWKECSDIVLHHDAIYKSVSSEAEAEEFFEKMAAEQKNKHGILPDIGVCSSYIVKLKTKIYQNEDNGFGVASFTIVDDPELADATFIGKGYYLPTVSGFRYSVNGKWVKDKKYGKQLEIISFTEMYEQEKEAVLQYLASGAIKGVGMKTACVIYDAFGEQTLAILDKEPERLLSLKGISAKKLEGILESYKETRLAKEVIAYLHKFHLSSDIGFRAYKVLGTDAIVKIKRNPFILCSVRGISFQLADEIAKAQNVAPTNEERIIACARHILKTNEINSGSMGMDLDDFGNKMLITLNHHSISKEFVCSKTIEMIRQKHILYKKVSENEKYIFLPESLETEERTAQNIVRLSMTEPEAYNHLDALIFDKEGEYCIELDETQKNTVKGVLENSFSIITGGPGTGKTTIVKIIASIWERTHKNQSALFMAPTGRAARKISESTGYSAMTIHKRLGIIEDVMPEDIVIDEKLVIIDEVSMLDGYLADKLFGCIEDGAKVILIGDVNQLPSVGPGSILKEIIESNVIPVYRLNTVHRQDEGSSICENVEKINHDCIDLLEDDTFKIEICDSLEEMQTLMVNNYIKDFHKYKAENVACLCPIKDKLAGVKEMNNAIQEIVNPSTGLDMEYERNNMTFRKGDLVMQLKNDSNVSNGDMGIISSISRGSNGIVIQVSFFHDVIEEYEGDRLSEITLAYAMTVHKSQGSEYKAVHTCLHSNYSKMMRCRNLLTTSLSRGKTYTTLYIDSYDTLYETIHNIMTQKRISMLSYYLKFNQGKEFVCVA